MLLLASGFLLVPLGVIVVKGVPGLAVMPVSVWGALGNSLMVTVASTSLGVGLALTIATAAVRVGWADVLGMMGFAASPLVLGTGLFLIITPWASPSALAFVVTALVNAVMVLPFALRVLSPALQSIEHDFGNLADSLDMRGWARFRFLILPRVRRSIGFAAGLAAAMSMGDLGVIALFADPTQATLPLQMYRLMGAYQMEAAAGAALLLLAASLSLFWIMDQGGRGNAEA